MSRLSGAGVPSRFGVPVKRLAVSDAQVAVLRRSRNWLTSAEWRKLRLAVFRRDGWVCQRTGVRVIAAHPAPHSPVAHHKVPHRGDPALFWDLDNIETVSKVWHDGSGQAAEKRAALNPNGGGGV